MIKVKVPATSANMGAGFDSLGIALGLYNYVYAEEAGDGLNIEILDDSAQYLVTDERNLVYRSMMAVFDKVSYKPKGIHLKLENNIMITRGLGSSSAGIVSGLLAANKLCGARLSKNELLNIAGVKASFVLTPYNNEVYVSARAIDEVNVQVMMERMGGGGHLNIAGAQVKATEDETEQMIKDIIDQLYQEGEFKE